MEGRWERVGVPVIQWMVIPAMVFGIGYFVIGPLLSGDAGNARSTSSREAAVEQPPIQPGPRKWNPVSPPQVNISVTPKYDPIDEYPLEDDFDLEPPVDETDDGATGVEDPDQATPPTRNQEQTTGGGSGEATTTTGTFQGITGRGGW